MLLELAILKNFDTDTYKAVIQLAESLTTYFDDIPVSRDIPTSSLVVGNRVILAIPGDNPKDACVIATWPQGSPGGAEVHGNEYHDPDFASEAALASHAAAATGVHNVGSNYIAKSSVDGLNLASHRDRHEWLGADALRIYTLLSVMQHLYVDWQTVDQWTESNTGSASQTLNILNLLLQTGATSGSVAQRRTSGNTIAPHDLPTIAFSYILNNWGIVQSASIMWLAVFRGTYSPSDTAVHVGWKIINGRIYATNANGTNQTITDTGDTSLASSSWAYKRLTHVCETTGTMKFYIGDTLVATHTTNLPTVGSSGGSFILQIENTDAVNQKINMRAIYVAGRLVG
ncbi:MAG: hypothetical protein WB564_07810 [Dehalococcoidia bacterium]